MSKAKSVIRTHRRIPAADLMITDEDATEARQMTRQEMMDANCVPWRHQPDPAYVYALVLGYEHVEHVDETDEDGPTGRKLRRTQWLMRDGSEMPGEYLCGKVGCYGVQRTREALQALEAAEDAAPEVERRSGTDRRDEANQRERLGKGRNAGRRKRDHARTLKESKLPQEMPVTDEETGETIERPQLSKIERAMGNSVKLQGDT